MVPSGLRTNRRRPGHRRLKIERETHKLEKRLCRLMGQAIVDFNMIEEGDKVMVCPERRQDSYSMLDILLKMQARAHPLSIVAVNLDQKQPGFPEHVLPEYLTALGIPFHIENQDTYSIVKDKDCEGKTMCSLCSRLRQGILYRVADELGATKIALGHHRDDMLQTFFLNMFFGGKLKGMPPKLVSDDGGMWSSAAGVCGRKGPARWAEHRQFPIIPCNLCGSRRTCSANRWARCCASGEKVPRPGGQHVQRAATRGALAPGRRRCTTSRPFKATGVPSEDGDKAFDADDFPPVRAAGPAGGEALTGGTPAGPAGPPLCC